jgi:hypothetical protein
LSSQATFSSIRQRRIFSICLDAATQQHIAIHPVRQTARVGRKSGSHFVEGKVMTRWKKKLQNPFALVAQGFIGGVILFWTFQAGESIAHDRTESVAAASSEQVQPGA